MFQLPIPPPDPLPLPMPPLILKALLLLTFGLHLLAVNIGVGGGAICTMFALRGKEEDLAWIRKAAPILPPAVTFAITLGVAPLLFIQLSYGQFFYSATILMALPWVALVFLLLAGYGLLYRFTGSLASDRVRIGAGILASLLLLGVGFMLVNMTTLSQRPDLWTLQAKEAPSATALNLHDPTLWPRFLHFATAILAIGSLFVGAWGAWRDQSSRARRMGLRLFGLLTLSQAAWGVWLLWAQPEALWKLLATLQHWPSHVLYTGLACALAAAVLALVASRAASNAKTAWPPVVLTMITVLCMVVMRDAARDVSHGLAGFHASALPYKTDWVSLGVFAVALVGLVVLLRVLVRWVLEATREKAHE